LLGIAALLWAAAGPADQASAAAAEQAAAARAVGQAAAATYRPLPAHVYAPYYETFLAPGTPGVAATARASGAKYLTLAFLQSAGKNSCAVDWNGDSSRPLDYYAADIASLRAAGGDVIPSFGGYAADQGGTEIADSCKSVSRIAAAYESVITSLGVTRLDMDVEARSVHNTAGIDRRNQAIALTEAWAAGRGIPLQIQYTLPVGQHGLAPYEVAVLRSAVANGATIASVNIMVFDYYIAGRGTVHMGQAAGNAATSTHAQLTGIYPGLSPARIWEMQAMTLLPGIDDYPKKTEVTSLSDAQAMLSLAQRNGMNLLSAWAIQRDSGGCPGTRSSNTCSGIAQGTWDFSHLLESLTR
jgi:hypothetical protein